MELNKMLVFLETIGFVSFILAQVTRAEGCANEVNPCGGHGDCVDNTCLCHAYYAGYECQECALCPGRFQHVWSCVECMFNANQDPESKRHCSALSSSGQCNNVEYEMAYTEDAQYNLRHEIAVRNCVFKYGVDIQRGSDVAVVYVKMNCAMV